MMLALKPLIDAKSQAAHVAMKESLGLNNKKLRLEDEEQEVYLGSAQKERVKLWNR